MLGPRVETPLHEHQRKALWWLRQQEQPRTAADVLGSGTQAMRDRGDAGIFKLVKERHTTKWVWVMALVSLQYFVYTHDAHPTGPTVCVTHRTVHADKQTAST